LGSVPAAGTVAVVTGGGHGIGRIICLAFAGIGARVVVAELDGAAGGAVADECAALGTEAIAIATDVGDEASVRRMADRVGERFGGADVRVNNAAIFATVAIAHDRLEALDAAEWDRVMAVNLRGPFLCARALVPQMRARRAGRIVNISSGTALHGGGAPIHYIASKAGVIGLTRALARELGPAGVTVNAIAPGATPTEATDAEERRRQEATVAARAIPRIQTPEDIAGTVLFLCSPAAGFMTGQTLAVDGGRMMR
ncbi:MAG: SDR family NAD(P)-dependent oxidoreductase, partial [Candidatus Limnocylindria bacterium]